MDIAINSENPVMNTGATGFVAGWIIKQLVESGVNVHACVRNTEDRTKISPLEELSSIGPGSVKIFKSDLLESGSYEKAMEGCSIVFQPAFEI